MDIKFVLDEFRRNAVSLPTSIQDMVAETIARSYQAAIESLPPNERPADIIDFYRNDPRGKELRQRVLNTPVPASFAKINFEPHKNMTIGAGSWSVPAPERAVRQLTEGVDLLRKATTLGEAQDILIRSTFPFISGFVKARAGREGGVDAMEILQESVIGVMDALPGYNPEAARKAGRKAATFEHYAGQSGALGGFKRFERREERARPTGTYSIEAMMAASDADGIGSGDDLGGPDIRGAEDVGTGVDPDQLYGIGPMVDPREVNRQRMARRLPDVIPTPFWTTSSASSGTLSLGQSVDWGGYAFKSAFTPEGGVIGFSQKKPRKGGVQVALTRDDVIGLARAYPDDPESRKAFARSVLKKQVGGQWDYEVASYWSEHGSSEAGLDQLLLPREEVIPQLKMLDKKWAEENKLYHSYRAILNDPGEQGERARALRKFANEVLEQFAGSMSFTGENPDWMSLEADALHMLNPNDADKFGEYKSQLTNREYLTLVRAQEAAIADSASRIEKYYRGAAMGGLPYRAQTETAQLWGPEAEDYLEYLESERNPFRGMGISIEDYRALRGKYGDLRGVGGGTSATLITGWERVDEEDVFTDLGRNNNTIYRQVRRPVVLAGRLAAAYRLGRYPENEPLSVGNLKHWRKEVRLPRKPGKSLQKPLRLEAIDFLPAERPEIAPLPDQDLVSVPAEDVELDPYNDPDDELRYFDRRLPASATEAAQLFEEEQAYISAVEELKPRSMHDPNLASHLKGEYTGIKGFFYNKKTKRGAVQWLRSRYPYVASLQTWGWSSGNKAIKELSTSKAVRLVESAPARQDLYRVVDKKTGQVLGRGTREEMKAITMEASKKGMYVGMTPVEEPPPWEGPAQPQAAVQAEAPKKARVQTTTNLSAGANRYQILTNAKEFLTGLPGGKNIKVAVASDPNINAQINIETDTVRLGERFFSDEYGQDPTGQAWHGGDVEEARRKTLAHEWGHRWHVPELETAAQDYLDRMQAERPDEWEALQQRVTKIQSDKKNRPRWAAREISATILASTIGYEANNLRTAWGMSDEDINQLQGIARSSEWRLAKERAGEKVAHSITPEDPFWDDLETPEEPPGYLVPPPPSDEDYMPPPPPDDFLIPPDLPPAKGGGGGKKPPNKPPQAAAASGSGRRRKGGRKKVDPKKAAALKEHFIAASQKHVSEKELEKMADMEELASSAPVGTTLQKAVEYTSGSAKYMAGGLPFDEGIVFQEYDPDGSDAESRVYKVGGRWDRGALAGLVLRGALHDNMAVAAAGNTFIGRPVPVRNAQGEIVVDRRGYPKDFYFEKPPLVSDTGEIIRPPEQTLAPEHVQAALSGVRTAWSQAFTEGSLPPNAKDLLGTVESRLYSSINKFVNNYVGELEKLAGDNPEMRQEAQKIGQRILSLSKDLMSGPMRALEGQLRADGFRTEGWRDLARNRIKLRGDDLDMMYANNPLFASMVDQAGGLAAVKGGPPTQFTVGGQAYEVGEFTPRSSGGRNIPFGHDRDFIDGNIWGAGKFGKFLYGAYIGKRLWGMTVGPAITEAGWFAQQQGVYAPTAAAVAGSAGLDFNLMRSVSGADIRLDAARKYFGQGAYEQFGGFLDLGYMVSGGSTSIARGAAGIKLGAGIAATSYLAPTLLGAILPQAAGLTSAAAALGPIGMALGLTMMAGTVGMELWNMAHPDSEPVTFGNWFQRKVSDALLYKGRKLAATKYGRWERKDQSAVPVNIDDDLALAQLSEEERNYVLSRGITRSEKIAQDATSAIRRHTGEDTPGIQAVLRSFSRTMALGQNMSVIEGFGRSAAAGGYTSSEYLSLLNTMGGQLGLVPSSQAYQNLLGWLAAGPSQAAIDAKMIWAGQVARYGGMLSPYYTDPLAANALVRRYDILTQGQAQAVQGFLSTLDQFGFDPSTVVGTRRQARGRGYEEVPVTLDELATALSKEVGPYRSLLGTSLMQSLMPFGMNPVEAMWAVRTFDVETDAQRSAALKWLQIAEQTGYTDPNTARAMMAYSTSMSPLQASTLAGVVQRMAVGGIAPSVAGGLVAGLGLTDLEAERLAQMAGGDLKAWSYQSYQTGNLFGRFYDMAGRPIYQSSGADFWGMLKSHAARQTIQVPGGGGFAYQNMDLFRQLFQYMMPVQTGIMTDKQAFTAWLGLENDPQMGSAFWESTTAAARLHNQRMLGFQMASIGVSMRGIQLQENYLWGADAGGAWDQPAPGSVWYIQDQMRRLQHKSQMASFAMQRERLELSRQQAIEQEQISRERLDISSNYQRWTLGFDYAGRLLQRQWMREDWAYQDQMRSLQNAWSLEDINEAIRLSSGRERKQLIKQRERMLLTQNLEGEQIETSRDRQEQLWAREDERHQKQVEYTESLIALDERQFELSRGQREKLYEMDKEALERSIEEYQRQKALQDQLTKLEREHQMQQIELQKQSLAIQAAAAAEQAKFQESMTKVTELWEIASGTFTTMVQNDPSTILLALSQFTDKLSDMNTSKPIAVTGLIASLSTMKTGGLKALEGLIEDINLVSPFKIKLIRDLLDDIGL